MVTFPSLTLVNERTNVTVASHAELAVTRQSRRTGLLGREGLEPSSALVIAPCWSIHTMFMRFAIDVIFVGTDGRALKVIEHLPPWRIAIARGSQAVIELAAGSLGGGEVRVGDSLALLTAAGARVGFSTAELRAAC